MIPLKNITYLILIMIVYTGCVNQTIHTNVIKKQNYLIQDLKDIEQRPSLFANKIESIPIQSYQNFKKDYAKNYFYPWHINNITFSLKNARWGDVYSKKKVYSENLTRISQKWFQKVFDNSNFIQFNSVRKKAITVNNSHLKVFPTISKIFYDPNEAGEGFPFDYNENTSIKLNTPLFISHLSKNKLWAYVESSMAIGWIEVKDIAYVDNSFIKIFENNDYYINIKDSISIFKNGYILNNVALGTLFPKGKKGFIIASKDYKNNGFIRLIDINDYFKPIGIEFNKKNLQKISEELINQRYGWGGLLGNRDCSLMIKDFYAPFGIFLHRNSKSQKYDGKVLDMSKLNNDEKKEYIIKNAIPFQTLLYLPGHIMIYVGLKDNEPLVFHNMWGIKTQDKNGKFGRNIIGKAAVTTLEVGKNLPNYVDKYSLLNRITSITQLTQ